MECCAEKQCCYKREGVLMLVFLAMYALVYASISLRLGLHWDEMHDIDGSATGEYVGAGRWGLALYRVVMGEGAFPLLAPLMAGGYICGALVAQVRMFRLNGVFLPLLYGGIYLSSIQWAYQLEFSHQCDAIALGILAATAGVWAVSRRRTLPGLALLTLSLGMYQSLGLYIAALFLLLHLADTKAGLSALGRPFLCLLAAVVAYSLLQVIALQLPWVNEGQIHYQRIYQVEMSKWSEYPHGSTSAEQARFLAYYGSRFAKMTAENMLGLAYGGQWVFATVLIPLAFTLRAQLRQQGGIGRAMICLLLWVLPFCLVLLTFSDQGARVSMAEPLVLAGFWGLFFKNYPLEGKMRCVLAGFVGFALLKSAYRVADIAVNESYVYHSNIACVREMHARGMALAESRGLQNARILLVGDIPFDPEVTWSRQQCLTERGYIPPKIFHFYTRYLKLDSLRYATPQEREAHRYAHDSMPTWPASGSVAEDKGDIIIRVD